MTTGAAWDVSRPEKPTALWDPQANIIIPIFVDDWLLMLGDTYGSHSIVTDDPLECVSQGLYINGIIGVRMRVKDSVPFTAGAKYPFTIRIVGTDTQTRDDRTLWLKVKER